MTETSMPRVVTTIAEFRTAIAQALATAQDALDRAARLEAEQNGTDVQYRTATLGTCPLWVPSTMATPPCCAALPSRTTLLSPLCL